MNDRNGGRDEDGASNSLLTIIEVLQYSFTTCWNRGMLTDEMSGKIRNMIFAIPFSQSLQLSGTKLVAPQRVDMYRRKLVVQLPLLSAREMSGGGGGRAMFPCWLKFDCSQFSVAVWLVLLSSG